MKPTFIRPGRLEDLPELHRLHASSPRCYYYDDLADFEEPDLLKGVNAVLVDQQKERLNGFVTFDCVKRSRALHASAPTKVSLRAAAFTSAGAAARLQFRALFEHAHQQLPRSPKGTSISRSPSKVGFVPAYLSAASTISMPYASTNANHLQSQTYLKPLHWALPNRPICQNRLKLMPQPSKPCGTWEHPNWNICIATVALKSPKSRTRQWVTLLFDLSQMDRLEDSVQPRSSVWPSNHQSRAVVLAASSLWPASPMPTKLE